MPPKAADKKKSTAASGDAKASLAPPPMPEEWKGTVKSLVFEPASTPAMYLGGRMTGRALCSPYNWPATNTVPAHDRKGADWEAGGSLHAYSRGIETP
eukprot:CAMPEP_0168443278 /NCGR_PEP_ID=MMETSP0228-20121227/44447_1 /TAXON_ID=133427 /ORGANISM="Protoceratium reticulatum, Strain CCCM 535 (=CCMP 1889)" /LENGTH=97 /DNA_ID=CAMNT_0008457677 /DNA_START=160 /DNA_END=453 /DNA_ORIENTATION=+